MSKKKIFLPMIETGGTHKMTAIAIKNSIEELYPERYDIEVSAWFAQIHKPSDHAIIKAWDLALKYLFLANLGYRLLSIYPFSKYSLEIFYPRVVPKAVNYFKTHHADIVVATHFMSARAALVAKKKLGLNYKILMLLTDPFIAHPVWAQKEIDYLLVASTKAKEELMEQGVDEKRIKLISYPIDNKFFLTTKTKAELQATYALNPNYKTFIASAGGAGISTLSEYIKEMYRLGKPFNVIYVCGKNQQLKAELEELKNTPSATNLVPLGFVSNMNELLMVSDFIVSKAGASTTFEALGMKKPIVYTSWAIHSEKPTIDYCLEHKIGWYANTKPLFFELLDQLNTTDLIAEYTQNIEQLGIHSGSNEIAAFTVEQLEG